VPKRGATEPQGQRDLRGSVAAALAYDPAKDAAPHVIASGRGVIAERIRNLAEAQGIPVREDRDLAELLVALDVGSEIPTAAFAAVAEILAYLYRANASLPAATAPSTAAVETSR
jgi:flagellar biosynthesis protein